MQKRKFQTPPGSIAVTAILLLTTSSVGASDTDAGLEQWLAGQVTLETWSADVVQTRKLKSLAQPLVAEGTLRVRQPQRFRWQLGDPPRTIAIGTPEGLLIAYPRLRQLERYDYSDAVDPAMRQVLDLLEVGFPSSEAAFHERYELLASTQSEGLARFELRPRSEDARRFLERVYIEADSTVAGLRATELVFPDGSIMRNEFSNAKVNPELDDSLFELEPSPDWQVSEPLAR